jgi:predicted dehydrogenase
VNVGIVGCGRVTGLRHLPALARIPDAQVVALADVDEDRVEALARRHGVAARYGSHAELLEDERVEAVAVCVPAALHAGMVVPALESGKHVLVEKPLALGLEDAELLRAAGAGSPSTTMVAFNLRWHRIVRRARELVLGGALGELEAVRTVFTSSFDYRDVAPPWRFRRDAGGGALVEMGPHHFDLWRFLSGLEVEAVHASTRSDDDDDVTAVVSGVLEGGVRATTLLSQRSTNANEVEILGSRGRLRVDLYRFDGLDVQLGRGFRGDLAGRVRGLARTVAAAPAYVPVARRGGHYVDSYRAEWLHFLDCTASGSPADPGFEDGVRNAEIVLAALESTSSGETVPTHRAAVAADA